MLYSSNIVDLSSVTALPAPAATLQVTPFHLRRVHHKQLSTGTTLAHVPARYYFSGKIRGASDGAFWFVIWYSDL
jgi:hypothetical protein